MKRLTTTPFGPRPVTAGLMQVRDLVERQPAPAEAAPDKWQVLNDLGAARAAFGLSDRELGVLSALVSFLPEQRLGGNASLVVFPSNRTLSGRLHGMPESTLRRHLARLVQAGVMLRHDSPNGKRYRRRGEAEVAFGFDLAPLRLRAGEIAQAAQATREAAERLRALREQVVLEKRDAQKLAAYGLEAGYPGDWEALLAALLVHTRVLRRKLDAEALEALAAEVSALHGKVIETLFDAEKASADAAHSGRHHQNSNTDTSDLELRAEEREAAAPRPAPPEDAVEIPFPLVLRAIPEALAYAQGPIRGFSDLVTLGGFLRGMIGISPSAWEDAKAAMGPEAAGVAVCCLVDRIETIRSPGGYLRALTAQCQKGSFSLSRLVMANINRERGKS
ncbi:MAG: plasmid replication protein RepC [Pseudomonadota bacterium]